ncbi:MAG: FKBP-type peptidyl-prolyl cis-trans isomerase [Proteobacteria bacterium]|nr:FKBP-type peptidyl-prolyl cis-trans isomerase [Pseudomonadota bacterium]
MKVVSLVVLSTVFAVGQVYAEDAAPKTDKDKISYSIGFGMGSNLKNQGVDVDADKLSKGIKDGLSGAKPAMSQADMDKTMTDLRTKMMAEQQEKMKSLGAKNKADGEAFLAKNKTATGVKTLPSGLQYQVIKAGTGKMPKATDKVSVNYRGTLLDGKEFDSSYSRGTPASFPVNGVIPGWTEALQLMKEGAKWKLFIPSSLAYGEQGAGGVIGPNATLLFEVELLKVE